MMEARTLKEQWQTLQATQPRLRIRDAASQLGVSEVELVATQDNNTRLDAKVDEILERLPLLGEVMALTRNDIAVHEVHAPFQGMRQRDKTIMFFREGQDTRYFTKAWAYVYAVDENERLSLQFFDVHGDAVHKIYMTAKSSFLAYHRVVKQFTSSDQAAPQPESKPETVTQPSIAIGEKALRTEWAAIRDVHQGSQIIKRYGDRLAVFNALGAEYARQLPVEAAETLLTQLSEQAEPCMIFAMNQHAVQSYAGTVNRLMRTGPWFNVLDPHFNLHLRTSDIDQVWLISKPSDDGWVHSFSIFDQQQQEALVITAHRKRGETESQQWLNIIQNYLVAE